MSDKSEDLADALVHMFDVNQAAALQDATKRREALTQAARQVVIAMRAYIIDEAQQAAGS